MRSYHRCAFSCFIHSFLQSLLISASQLLLWCGFAFLSYYLFERFSLSALYCVLPCLLLVLIVRFYITNVLLHLLDPLSPRINPITKLILPALYRLITGILWLLPFAAVMYRFYQYIFVLPATTFTSDFTKIGAALSHDASLASQLLIGTTVFFAILFLTFIIFLYGWRRGNCFDLAQTQNASFLHSIKISRKMRRASRSRRLFNTCFHTLILLPAFIIPCLIPMRQLSPLLTGKAMNDIQLLYAYLSAGIVSDGTLLLSFSLFLVLYLPWLPFRKLHNIAAVVVRHD